MSWSQSLPKASTLEAMAIGRHWVCALVLIGAANAAHAGPIPRSSRIAVSGGWRWTPNDTFLRQAADNGYALEGPSVGGPILQGTFAYQAFHPLELAIELGMALERFHKQDGGDLWLQSIPVLLMLRWWFGGSGRVAFFLGGGFGLYLNFWQGAPDGYVESNATTPVVAAGLTIDLTPQLALVVEDRQYLARSAVPSVGFAQVGGNALCVGLQVAFPPENAPLP